MKRIKIFCEGVTDQVFIADCLEVFYNIPITRKVHAKDSNKWEISFGEHCQVIEIGGCSKLSDKIYQDMFSDNIDEGGKNIVVFDADFGLNAAGAKSETGNMGFTNAKKKLEAFCNIIQIEFYLWPNNKDDGEIEQLLRQLIPKEREVIFKCVENHQKCLQNSNIADVNLADLKLQVGYYLHSSSRKSEPRLRNYRETNCWNLKIDDCESLRNFKKFLDGFFTQII